MRFEDMTAEQVERARKCETAEERKAFIEAEGIELSDEQLDGIAGGRKKPGGSGLCLHDEPHNWKRTGNTRPGMIFGDTWPDKEERCTRCGKTRWVN